MFGCSTINVFVACGSRMRPIILECVCMSSVVLLICKASLVLYTVGSGVKSESFRVSVCMLLCVVVIVTSSVLCELCVFRRSGFV